MWWTTVLESWIWWIQTNNSTGNLIECMLSNCNYYIVSFFILGCPNWTLNLYLSNIEYLNRLLYYTFKLQICHQGGLQLQSTSRGLWTDSKGGCRPSGSYFPFPLTRLGAMAMRSLVPVLAAIPEIGGGHRKSGWCQAEGGVLSSLVDSENSWDRGWVPPGRAGSRIGQSRKTKTKFW